MFNFINFTIETLKAFLATFEKATIDEAVEKWNAAIPENNAYIVSKAIMDNLDNDLRIKSWVVAEIPLWVLFTDSYQRVFNMDKIRKNLAMFDINKIDIKTVNYRNGKFYLVDGWHTAILLMLAGKETITVKITKGLSREKEAELFAYQDNGKTRVPKATKFWALLQAGMPEQTEIRRICESRGYKISKGTRRKEGGYEITAVGTLEDLYETNTLNLAFDILKDSGFESQTEAFNARFLHAFKVLREYNFKKGDAAYTMLITTMKACGSPTRFLETCKDEIKAPKGGRDLMEAYIQAYFRKTLAALQKPEYRKEAK